VLATQNPVDLDYKGLANCGTWLIGRLQTERDKMRVIEGLEGASAQAGSTFNKQQMERTLAGLGNRIFLMNNVHDDGPVVFETRWTMSYLRGPLTKDQIKILMAGRKPENPAPVAAAASGKSTLAREIAKRLGLVMINSGAMYRAVTWKVLQEAIDPDDTAAVIAAASAGSTATTPSAVSAARRPSSRDVPAADRPRRKASFKAARPT